MKRIVSSLSLLVLVSCGLLLVSCGLLVVSCGPPAPTTPVTIGEKIPSKHASLSPSDVSPGKDQLGKAPDDMPSPHGGHGNPGSSDTPLMTSALGKAAKDATIVTIDGVNYTKADHERALLQAAGLAGIPPDMLDAQTRTAFEQPAYEKLIERTLLVKEAKKRKLWPSDAEAAQKREEIVKTLPPGKTLDQMLKAVAADEKSFAEDLRVDVAIGKLLQDIEKNVPPPPPAQVEAVYQQNKSVFDIPDITAAAHILVRVDRGAGKDVIDEKRKLALAIKAQVTGQDDAVFARVAREKSDDPSGRQSGGDLGALRRGDYLPEFEKVAFSLKEGEVAGPVQTDRGFHIIKSGGTTKGKTVSAKEAKEVIAERERVKLFLSAVDDLVEELRKGATIVRVIEPVPSPFVDKEGKGSRVPNWRATGKNAVKGMGNPHAKGPALRMPNIPGVKAGGGHEGHDH